MKVLIAETPTTHMMVTNMSKHITSFIPIEDWEKTKPMLSENSVYEEVHITRNYNIYRMEDLKNEVNRTAAI